MAHELDLKSAMPGLLRNQSLDSEAVRQARVDLAASCRMAARLDLQAGMNDHFSALVPGHDELFLVNPQGWAFAEITASKLLICDFEGQVVAGQGRPDAMAGMIHAQLHKALPRAAAAFHSQMPNAAALSMVEGPPLVWADRNTLTFYGRTVVAEGSGGLAPDASEGARIAATIGAADIVFLRNQGVLVLGPSIAEAFDDLRALERAAELQAKALSLGRPLKPIAPEIAERLARQRREGARESARLHLESVKRQLARTDPDFAH